MRTLQELRKAKGLTAYQLEDAAGVGRLFVARLESGQTNPENVRIGYAHKIAVILGISLDEFYMITTNAEPNHQKGSPLMVKGQPRKIGGNRWKNRPKSPAEKSEVTATMVDTTPETVELPIIPVVVNDREKDND